MAHHKESSPEELAASRDTRIATRRLDQHRRYLALLHHAQRIRLNSNAPDTLGSIIASGEAELQGLRARAGGRMSPRRRPQRTSNDAANTFTIFIDECGTYSLTANDPFEAFILAAVIIPDGNYPKLDEQWKRWKADNLGSPKKIVHEPNLRKGNGPFYFKGDTTKRTLVTESLRELLAKLDFAAVACVVNRPEYVVQLGVERLDESLPGHPYLMTLDFLMERLEWY